MRGRFNQTQHEEHDFGSLPKEWRKVHGQWVRVVICPTKGQPRPQPVGQHFKQLHPQHLTEGLSVLEELSK